MSNDKQYFCGVGSIDVGGVCRLTFGQPVKQAIIDKLKKLPADEKATKTVFELLSSKNRIVTAEKMEQLLKAKEDGGLRAVSDAKEEDQNKPVAPDKPKGK